MTPEDKDLILKAIRGEPDAINQVATRYGEFANRVAWKIVKNSVDAADITQEVLLKLVSSLHTLKAVESFQGWLYRITYRASLNWLRVRRHPLFVEELSNENATTSTVDEDGDRESQLERIAEAARTLPPPYRVIVKMFYYENCPCRQIAAVLGTSEGAIKVQLHRARAMMRKMIEDEEGTTKRRTVRREARRP